MTISEKSLIEFEERVIETYNKGLIYHPVHLSLGTEKALIGIFKKFKISKDDWIFTTYRNHYHWILSGRDSKVLFQKILKGGSMHIYDDKFFTSSIVGGHLPIAVGLADAIKKKKSRDRVFCFLGDMAAETGIAHESIKYALRHRLPIYFIVEDNGLSVKTKTQEVWGPFSPAKKRLLRYRYIRNCPHQGAGEWVLF